jgi:hypothetical protein
MKAWALGLALATSVAAGAAHAATVSGTFIIDIYNYDAGHNSAEASATDANIASHTKLTTITYTGALDFKTDTASGAPSIAEFLNTGSGSYTVPVGVDLSSIVLSEGSGSGASQQFGTTTLFDIKATAFNAIIDGTGNISHDDGITFFDDGTPTASSAGPTTQIITPFTFDGGSFRLIYAAANGDPSVLHVEGTVVPLPATALLLLSGLAGLLAMTGLRKRV